MISLNSFHVWIDNPHPLSAPKLADFLAIFRRDFAEKVDEEIAEYDFNEFGEEEKFEFREDNDE